MIDVESFTVVLDLGGTFVFAISGAMAAVHRRLDLFGVLVLSFVAGNLGGIGRDLLIGAVPPAALSDARYLVTRAGAVTLVFSEAPAWSAVADTHLDAESLVGLVGQVGLDGQAPR